MSAMFSSKSGGAGELRERFPFWKIWKGFLRFYAPGEKWFHHTLVDADQAINSMMWQNAGKSGLDQWNFTMNAASAGKTQDPKGPVLMERDD